MINNSMVCKQETTTPKCKVTVMGKMPQDQTGENRQFGQMLCPYFSEGQEFIIDIHPSEGFCNLAWDDISKAYATLVNGGTCPEEQDMIVARCRDTIRPVFFKLERIDN